MGAEPKPAPLEQRVNDLEGYYRRRVDTIDRSITRLSRSTYVVLAFLAAVTLGLGALSISLQLRFGTAVSDARHAAQQAAAVASSAVQGQQVLLCHRLNKHRAADNINSYSSWKVNVLFASALAHPVRTTLPQTPEQKKLTARFLKLLEGDVNAQSWTPLTRDCLNHPGEGADPILFVTRQPAPKDLRVGPGE